MGGPQKAQNRWHDNAQCMTPDCNCKCWQALPLCRTWGQVQERAHGGGTVQQQQRNVIHLGTNGKRVYGVLVQLMERAHPFAQQLLLGSGLQAQRGPQPIGL